MLIVERFRQSVMQGRHDSHMKRLMGIGGACGSVDLVHIFAQRHRVRQKLTCQFEDGIERPYLPRRQRSRITPRHPLQLDFHSAGAVVEAIQFQGVVLGSGVSGRRLLHRRCRGCRYFRCRGRRGCRFGGCRCLSRCL